MNETCAGGTGAFIDQMAHFIGTNAAGLDALALRCRTFYPIASRCGWWTSGLITPGSTGPARWWPTPTAWRCCS